MTDVKDSPGNAPAVETPRNMTKPNIPRQNMTKLNIPRQNMTKLSIPRQNMTNAQQRTKYDKN